MTRALPWLWAASVLFLLALAIWGEFWLKTAGGGIFDGRFGGYDLDAARAYLRGLTEVQLARYLGPFRIADTVFPALMAVTLVVTIRRLAQGIVRLVLLVVTALYLAADYTENALVAAVLRTGPDDITTDMINTASMFTLTKWAALSVVLLACAVLWWRARR